jgi:hypothetical protein
MAAEMLLDEAQRQWRRLLLDLPASIGENHLRPRRSVLHIEIEAELVPVA